MSDKLNEAIQGIAMKHGIVLNKDDPILILHTMNEKLLEENRKAHEDLLVRFKEEMEHISSQWKDETKEKAEKILNAALAGAKEVMAKLLHESTRDLVELMKKMVLDSLIEIQVKVQQTRKHSHFILLFSGAILSSSSLFMFQFLKHALQ